MVMEKQAQQQETEITYERIIEKEEYSIGIAYLDNPAGRFEIRVSGPHKRVEDYQGARVLKMVLRELDEGGLQEQQEELRAEIEEQRELWHTRLEQHCETMHDIIEDADLEQLTTPHELYRRLCQGIMPKDVYTERLDLRGRDRLIEIIPPLSAHDQGGTAQTPYHLEFQIDPPMQGGERDIYVPAVTNVKKAKATLDRDQEEAYLRLYSISDGVKTFRDNSKFKTKNSVSARAWQEEISWELRVVALLDIHEYTVTGDWYFSHTV